MLARLLAQVLAQILSLVFPLRADELLVEEAGSDTLLALLAPELVPLGEGMLAASLLPFTDERVRAAIHEAKYQGNPRAFTLLASVLEEYLREVMAESFHTTTYVVVPVPLGRARRAERGFNQVEEVAARTAKVLDITLDPSLLTRTRETASQVALPRKKRLANMRGAFACARPPDAAYTYIVVDDVLTTGATLSAAYTALSTAGAAEVLAVALAH